MQMARFVMLRKMRHAAADCKLYSRGRCGSLAPMTKDDIDAHCLSLPGAHKVVQWKGAQVYKVAEKLFAIIGGDGGRITLKCADAETAAFLIEIGAATPAPHLKRGGWISLQIDDVGDEEMAERVTTSYATVRDSLPKRLREALV